MNAALSSALDGAEDVTVRDMYSLYPDFQINVAEGQQLAAEADRIVLQFPMYWYSSPALLKQWEDAVLTYAWAYGSTGTALHGKDLLVADVRLHPTKGQVSTRLVENEPYASAPASYAGAETQELGCSIQMARLELGISGEREPDGLYTVAEVARMLQISVHTVRYYTDQGLIPPIQRDSNGSRLFNRESLN